jgi:putative membrane protein insertion efficiency factor
MKQAVRYVLWMYKRWLSPMLPHSCRFVPTCSEYALEAVELHGALQGTLLGAKRLLRCHPLARAGYDPVPRLEQVFRPASPRANEVRFGRRGCDLDVRSQENSDAQRRPNSPLSLNGNSTLG